MIFLEEDGVEQVALEEDGVEQVALESHWGFETMSVLVESEAVVEVKNHKKPFVRE